ncbi:hypothetical protein [Saccharopolyspora hattusasensis]|uniref:hypothetical protein n=1 Tax=Saccharopolyspora hattusasensis TaxID=1128679 RepID=UPI003D97C077
MTSVGELARVSAFGQGVQGLEILRLPYPDVGFASVDCDVHPPPGWGPSPVGDECALARYRWWIGHQTTFCVWRVLADCLKELTRQRRPSSELIRGAALTYDVYSLLLLYAGSCSVDVYDRTIRPEMAAAESAFSGRWARDYDLVPALLREVRKQHPAHATAPLTAASKANLVVHMAVAHRLARGGESLLRMASQEADIVTDQRRDLYDAYFHVRRTEICRQGFAMQLLRLCMVVLDDLSSTPLVVPTDWAGARPAEIDAVARSVTDSSMNLWNLVTSNFLGRLLP